MCRMLGIYGEVDNWKEIALSFSQHAETGKVPPKKGTLPGHKDGWGMAVSDSKNNTMVILDRQPGSAADADRFKQTLTAIKKQPTIFICHLRKASPGIAVTLKNIHPFFADDFSFIHNGTIYQSESLPRDPSLQMTSDGSDSEHFFHYLLTQLKKKAAGLESAQSLAQAFSAITVDYTALNSFLTNGRELFVIRKSARSRHMAITVSPHGLVEVVVPRSARPTEVEAFVRLHRKWIDRALGEFQKNRPEIDRSMPQTIVLPAIDSRWTVQYDSKNLSDRDGVVFVPTSMRDRSRCRLQLQQWLKRKARTHLNPRLHALADERGFVFKRVQVRGQRTRWGSYSSSGTVSLNFCLLFMQPELVEHLMLHELCHTREMNHSRRFWQLLADQQPVTGRVEELVLVGEVIRKVLALLSPKERRHAYRLLGMVLVMAFLDVMGVASIMPFMAI